MTINEWADFASTVESFVVSIAIIFGGGWALFQFISLNSIAKARAELEAAKRALRQRGIVNITKRAPKHKNNGK
jgi:hypothetical protein